MLLLSLESSAVAASVCVTEDEKLIAQSFQNCGLTHSRTLLPMVESLLQSIGMSLSQIDGYAIAYGPGSFTGVRIGVATVKGLAQATDKKCMGVSSLEAMARALGPRPEIICAAMDARRHQVYNALFQWQDGQFVRLTPDRAISLADLAEELLSLGQSYVLVGDGANLCYNTWKEQIPNLSLAAPNLRYQSAYGVAAAALAGSGKWVEARALLPFYLRAPQAERERQAKSSPTGGNET